MITIFHFRNRRGIRVNSSTEYQDEEYLAALHDFVELMAGNDIVDMWLYSGVDKDDSVLLREWKNDQS